MHAGSATENGRCSHHTSPLNTYCRRAQITLQMRAICNLELIYIHIAQNRTQVERRAVNGYLGSVMRSLADTSGLHLSLMVADLPSLQACVDTEDLKMITRMRNTNATTSLCHVFVSKYFLTLVPLFLFVSKYQHEIITSETGTT